MRVVNSGRLTATSYAVLGLLAQRDYSAYELNKEIQRSLGHVWPRSERGIYDEVKWLDQLGLAEATISYKGRQRRTTYSISTAGRKTVDAWLDKPADRGVSFESEGLLRLFLSVAAEPKRLLAALDAIEAEADKIVVDALSMDEDELEDEAQRSETSVRWRAHSHDFLASYALMLKTWAERTREIADAWQHDADVDVVKREALELSVDAQARVSEAHRSA